ncbi:hypothetical protein DSO57_1024630 [Entomophthora muscae]|uniref:Uncharacterized protein n=1 Tax=Entomophthora muscae TaxID=34485 RepID=A0ACC2U0D9_9FUNG|nr:hypothetical protein DSO57_1024630 [Entomophthora muscae]
MKVSKVQHVATLRISHNEELSAVHFLGGPEELGISLPDEPLVAAIIPQDNMVCLSEDKKIPLRPSWMSSRTFFLRPMKTWVVQKGNSIRLM